MCFLYSLSAPQHYFQTPIPSSSTCPIPQLRQNPPLDQRPCYTPEVQPPTWMKTPCWIRGHIGHKKSRPKRPEDQKGNRNHGTKHSSNEDKHRNWHLDRPTITSNLNASIKTQHSQESMAPPDPNYCTTATMEYFNVTEAQENGLCEDYRGP